MRPIATRERSAPAYLHPAVERLSNLLLGDCMTTHVRLLRFRVEEEADLHPLRIRGQTGEFAPPVSIDAFESVEADADAALFALWDDRAEETG